MIFSISGILYSLTSILSNQKGNNLISWLKVLACLEGIVFLRKKNVQNMMLKITGLI